MTKLKNTNCLEGVRCPECGAEHEFRIKAEVLVLVRDNGTQDDGAGYEWDNNSYARCTECQHEATFREFSINQYDPSASAANRYQIDGKGATTSCLIWRRD